MQDLKDVTHDVHYENYRIQCLSHLASNSGAEQRSQRVKRDSFQIKQESTEKLLHEKDEEIRKMQAMLKQMQAQLNQSSSGAPSLDSSTMV